MTTREQQSRAIEILRFPLASLVVAIHCYYFNTQCINTLSGGVMPEIVKWTINIISIVLTDCAVPMFYVISGYLFFIKKSHFTTKEYVRKIQGKLYTLIIPYLCWNVIAIFALPNFFINATLSEKIFGFWSTSMEWGKWSGPWDGPLWFIRDLFIVMLFSPLLSIIVRRTSLLLPILLVIPYIAGFEAICPGLSTVSFLFFSVGAWLAVYRPQFSQTFTHKKIIVIALLTILFAISRICVMAGIITDMAKYINLLWILCSMTTYYIIAQSIGVHTKKFTIWKKLGAASFVIFAMHSLINGRISSILLHIASKENVGNGLTILFYLITIIATIAICYYSHTLIQKNKILSALLEGGRNR